MALSLRLRACPGEPPHGALLRLAARHRRTDISNFALEIGCSLKGVLLGRQVEKIANLSGIDVSMLIRYAPVLDVPSRSVILADQKLLLNDWSTKRRRWCPACLRFDLKIARADGKSLETACWHRASWDVRSVSSCPLHRLILSDLCPACGKPQDWRGPTIARCACGGDLCSVNSAKLQSWEGAASTYASSRLGFAAAHTVPLLDRLTLKDAMVVIERLGEAASLGNRSHKDSEGRRDSVNMRDLGMAVALGWPGSFQDALDRVLAERRRSSGPSGLIGGYGWIYSEWATGALPDDFGEKLRVVLREHAIQNSVISLHEPVFANNRSDSVPITTAARMLGLRYNGARKIIAANGLLPTAVRRGVAAPLSSKDIEDVRETLSRQLRMKDLAQRLAISRAQARKLVAHRLISEAETLKATRRFEAANVEQLLKSLSKGVIEKTSIANNLTPLSAACKANGIKVSVAVDAIISGRLRIDGILKGVNGLGQFLIDPINLKTFRPDKGLTEKAVSKFLGLHCDMVRWLIRYGIISRIDKFSRPNISKESVIKFSEKYVRGADVAKIMNTSPRSVLEKLRCIGLAPAFGPPQCRQIIFDRDRLKILGVLG